MASLAVSMNNKDDNIKIFSMAKYTDQKEKICMYTLMFSKE